MKLKKFAAAVSAALMLAVFTAAPALAVDEIQVNEDISVSGDYDWTRFANDHITLNVYNNGLYISDGSDDSVNVVSAFEDLTGIKVNYTTSISAPSTPTISAASGKATQKPRAPLKRSTSEYAT